MLRTVAGAVVGYLLSAISSILFFRLTGHGPHTVQPAWFMAVTTVFGIVASAICGYIAARIGGYSAGFAVGVIIFTVSLLMLLFDHRDPAWSFYIALVAMSPAAVLGAKLARGRSS